MFQDFLTYNHARNLLKIYIYMREIHKAHSAIDGNSNESSNHQHEWSSSQMKYHDVIDAT